MSDIFSFNLVDLLIVVVLFIFIISSWGRGFVATLVDLFGFLFSFTLALKFYAILAKILAGYLLLPMGLSNALAFIILGFLLETLFFIIIHLVIDNFPQKIITSLPNRIFGALPALVNGLVVSAFFLSVIIATPVSPKIKQNIFDSKLASLLLSHTQIFEQEISAVFEEAVSDTLSFITINPSSSERVDLQFKINNFSVDNQAEKEMSKLVNQERNAQGSKVLVFDEELAEVAREHGKDMFSKGYFSHVNLEGKSPFDRLDDAGIDYQQAGENLAFAPNTLLAHQGLMQSPNHRENILSSSYQRVGIGVIDGGIYGKMFVQLFSN